MVKSLYQNKNKFKEAESYQKVCSVFQRKVNKLRKKILMYQKSEKRKINDFYNDFILASHCNKDLKLFKKKFKKYFKLEKWEGLTKEKNGKKQRTIKFRAWHKDNKKMVKDISVLRDNDYIYMQFTELKDKKGKKIYESDIVKFRITNYNTHNYEYPLGKVVFSEGMFLLKPTNKGYYLIDRKDMIVKGNIYENPELLKKLTKEKNGKTNM